MANRKTVKSNINALNIPSVSNADLGQMLNSELADNLKFREEVALAQNSSVSNITCNFSGKDRIELTRTGGSLNIQAANIGDGEEVILYISKTAGQPVTFTAYTDITPVKQNVTNAAIVAYKLKRIGVYKICWALLETVKSATETNEGVVFKATQAECNALSNTAKFVTPGNIPIASDIQKGVAMAASNADTEAQNSYNKFVSIVNFKSKVTEWWNTLFNTKQASKILEFGSVTVLGSGSGGVSTHLISHSDFGTIDYHVIMSLSFANNYAGRTFMVLLDKNSTLTTSEFTAKILTNEPSAFIATINWIAYKL